MLQENLSDQIVESLSFSNEEAIEQHARFQSLGARLLLGIWYVEPNKEQAIEDFKRYLERRPIGEACDTRHIGRAVIQGSDMIGLALWQPAAQEMVQ